MPLGRDISLAARPGAAASASRYGISGPLIAAFFGSLNRLVAGYAGRGRSEHGPDSESSTWSMAIPPKSCWALANRRCWGTRPAQRALRHCRGQHPVSSPATSAASRSAFAAGSSSMRRGCRASPMRRSCSSRSAQIVLPVINHHHVDHGSADDPRRPAGLSFSGLGAQARRRPISARLLGRRPPRSCSPRRMMSIISRSD